MDAAIVVFPGSNRESDMRLALRNTIGREPKMVWHSQTELPKVDLVVIPGGFSYGDYLRPGAIAARALIMPAILRHAAQGRYILGVCNGFQILTEAGLLPGALIRNVNLKFICRFIHLRIERCDLAFTDSYRHSQIIKCPIANHDGNYFANHELLTRIEGQGQVVLRYCDGAGETTNKANPNGSINNIAGITDPLGKIMGLMPHPENSIDGLDLLRI